MRTISFYLETFVDFTYTVVAADSDSNGVSIPANSISGPTWTDGSSIGISRNHAALSDQAGHAVGAVLPSIGIVTVPATTLAVNESASANYTVGLASTPAGTVTVSVTSDNSDVTVDTSTTSGVQTALTFTTTNWNTAQTVTASAAGDAGSADEAAILTHTADSANIGVHTLLVAVQDDEQTGTDYDADEDGLIDIDSLDKLNAMRWDLNGDGAVSAGDTANYTNAFPGAATGMGCPDRGDADDEPDPCVGYELTSDLDFDTDGSGGTWTGDTASPVADPDDAYYNAGAGWTPIGSRAARFNTTFDGGGHVIANLYSQQGANDVGVFAATGASARVVAVGFRNLRVRGWNQVGGLVGHNQGRIAGVWVTGNVHGGNVVGGLVGATQTASSVIVASYSRATVHAGSQSAGLAGWNDSASFIRTSYSTGAAGGADGFSRGTGTVVTSYWDTDLSTISDDANTASPEGRTSTQLQAPTEYGSSGLYADWDDQDVDGDSTGGEAVDDDAWDFGTSLQHPALKFGGLDTYVQFNLQPPSFATSTVSNIGNARTGVSLTVPIPEAAHASAVTYTVTGLPPGMLFDADGAGGCSAQRTVCGAPTRTGIFTVIVRAVSADGRVSSSGLSFTITVGGVEIDANPATTGVVEAGPHRPRRGRRRNHLPSVPDAADVRADGRRDGDHRQRQPGRRDRGRHRQRHPRRADAAVVHDERLEQLADGDCARRAGRGLPERDRGRHPLRQRRRLHRPGGDLDGDGGR